MSEKIWNDSDKYIEILTRNTVLIADSDFSHSTEIRFEDADASDLVIGIEKMMSKEGTDVDLFTVDKAVRTAFKTVDGKSGAEADAVRDKLLRIMISIMADVVGNKLSCVRFHDMSLDVEIADDCF